MRNKRGRIERNAVIRKYYVNKNGEILFDYPVYSKKVLNILLPKIIEFTFDKIERMEDEEKKQQMQIGLMVFANCYERINRE